MSPDEDSEANERRSESPSERAEKLLRNEKRKLLQLVPFCSSGTKAAIVAVRGAIKILKLVAAGYRIVCIGPDGKAFELGLSDAEVKATVETLDAELAEGLEG